MITRSVKMIRGSLSYNEVEVLVNGFYMMCVSRKEFADNVMISKRIKTRFVSVF